MKYLAMKAAASSRAFARIFQFALIALASLPSVDNARAQDRSKNPQYGMAHRVNTAVYIDDAIDPNLGGGSSAATGIEFDIYYHAASTTWIVTHGDIVDPATQPSLTYWLQTLSGLLTGSNAFDQSFAALYVDVKTPNSGSFATVMNMVRQYIPSTVTVLYALNDIENFETATTGYDTIKSVGLLPNEGISCWADEVDHVDRYYQVIKRDQIERAVIDHGNFGGTNEDILTEANQTKYHDIRDPYRFKKVIAWTFDFQSSMEDYMDPSHSYHTDGLLVGAAGGQYLPHFADLDDFDGAIDTFSSSQRKADRTDRISFWERSGSDYVSGDLIHVNNVDAGARKTGAKWEPYGTVTAGVTAASVNAANPPPKIVISSTSNYTGSPASPYTGVTRIAKRCRLEKAPSPGGVRISP